MTVTSNIDKKALIANIAIPVAVGAVSGLINSRGFKNYAEMTKPPLSPPSWVFPVVWTILYILMGISSYLVYERKSDDGKRAFTFYAIQLALNFMWPVFFFGFEAYLFSFIWLVLLWIFQLATLISFYRINKTAGLLQIPYLLWLTFAGYLNLSVYLLN